ncbi:MAG TPA: VOC family protein [Rhodoglobus sp.]|mgnify:CR=1 FL=1|nr:VOC family protein [Rhodoglobus sp.]
MTNEAVSASTPETIEHDNTPNTVRFGMVVVYARDLQASIDFYRLVGLDVSDPHPDRPVAAWNEGADTRLIITTDPVATRFDQNWARPQRGGYQQVVEFFVDDDAAVDAAWERLTAAGYNGTSAPGHLLKPYATMVEDPDGNVVLITHEPPTDAETTASE